MFPDLILGKTSWMLLFRQPFGERNKDYNKIRGKGIIPDLDTPNCEHQKLRVVTEPSESALNFLKVWHHSTNLGFPAANLETGWACLFYVGVFFLLFAWAPWRCYFFGFLSLFVYPSPNRELSTPAALWVRKGQHAKGSFLCPVSSVNPERPASWEESQGYNNATGSCWMLHKQGGIKREEKNPQSKKMSLFSPALGICLCDRTSLHKGIFKSQQSPLLGLSGWASASFSCPAQISAALWSIWDTWQNKEAKPDRCLRSVWWLRKHQIWNSVWSKLYGDYFFSSSSSLPLYISDHGRIDPHVNTTCRLKFQYIASNVGWK